MLKIFLLITLQSYFINNDSLIFNEYHTATNKAEMLIYEGKSSESLEKYKYDFSILKQNITDLTNATIVASVC